MVQADRETSEFYTVRRPAQPVCWEVDVPGSKSITNRALLLAALSPDPVQVEQIQLGDDARTFLTALAALGIPFRLDEERHLVTVEGCGGRIPRDGARIDVGSAGTAARFLTAVLGLSDVTCRILASEQMKRRPMRGLFEALLSLGAQISWLGEEWHLPVDLVGAARHPARDPSDGRPATLELDLCKSTQFLSALLMAAPTFPGGLRVHISGEKKTGPYIDMTMEMMRRFGAEVRFEDPADGGSGDYAVPAQGPYRRAKPYAVEPDVSAACYFYAAAAVTGGSVLVNRVYPEGLQGDIRFLDVLCRMGCTVANGARGITVRGPSPGGLQGVTADMRDFSDQALTLAAIAPYANGPVEIRGIAHVRAQESDRIRAIVTNLRRAGISCEELADGVRIEPGVPGPCRIETFDDHRVAMAFAVMGLGADGIKIGNPGCCSKTFADYFEVLDSLLGGGKGDCL